MHACNVDCDISPPVPAAVADKAVETPFVICGAFIADVDLVSAGDVGDGFRASSPMGDIAATCACKYRVL